MAFTLPLGQVIVMEPAAAANEVPALRAPTPSTGDPGQGRALEIVVIFTELKPTLDAIRTAASLAHGLDAGIHVVVPQIVPYPLPLEQPPVSREFTECKLGALLPCGSIPTWVDVRLCRDEDAIPGVLAPKSLIVMGVRAGWWPRRDRHLAKLLMKDGHRVVLAGSAEDSHA